MADLDDILTKACVVCGQRKPLSSFLKMPGAKGTVIYGNMCSDCRKANLEKLKKKEREESTRSSTGFKIDSKAKVVDDLEKVLTQQETEEQYHEERDEEEEKLGVQEEKKEQILKKEREHRDTFLKKSPTTYQALSTSELLTPAQEQAAKEAQIDLSTSVIDTAQPKAKFQSASFNRFKAWLGGSAPIVRQAEKMNEKLGTEQTKEWPNANTPAAEQAEKTEKKVASSKNLFAESSKKVEQPESTMGPAEFIEKNTPKSPRR